MTPTGAGIHGSIYHSHSFESWATRLPGWKIVMPSDPLSAYGLMLSAIKDPNPVLYLKPKAWLRVKGKAKIPGEPEKENELRKKIDAPLGDRSQWKPKWPKLKSFDIPLGKGAILQEGSDVTVVSFGRSLFLCQKAIETMTEEERTKVELIDMRTLYPYDWSLIKSSILKTKRALFVNEDTEVTNFAEHLAYRVSEELFYSLYAPPRVLAGKNVPGIGLHPNLEKATVPQETDIALAIKELLATAP